MLSTRYIITLFILFGCGSIRPFLLTTLLNEFSPSQKALVITSTIAFGTLLGVINCYTYSYRWCIKNIMRRGQSSYEASRAELEELRAMTEDDFNKLPEGNKTGQRQRQKQRLINLEKLHNTYKTPDQMVEKYVFPLTIKILSAIGIIPFIITLAIVGFNKHENHLQHTY